MPPSKYMTDQVHYLQKAFVCPNMPCNYGWVAELNLLDEEGKLDSQGKLLGALQKRPSKAFPMFEGSWERHRSPRWMVDVKRQPTDGLYQWQWINDSNHVVAYSAIETSANAVYFFVMAENQQICDEVCEALNQWYLENDFEPKKREEPPGDEVCVVFWNLSQRGPRGVEKNIKCPTMDEIKDNYPKKVMEGMNWTANHPDPLNTGKLIFWMGPPGTGKTWGVRALMRAWNERAKCHVITDPEVFFNNTEYLQAVIENTVSDRLNLIIIEDSPRVVLQEARGTFETHAMSRLLNLTDGLWGEASQTIFMMTTNDDIDDIDPAFLRDGRLLQRLSFRPFDEEEANAWLSERGVEESLDEECDTIPLCRLYGILRDAAGSRIRSEEEKLNPMGFKTTGIFETTKKESAEKC